jgi:AcrR family transcriptional regulator
MIAVHAHVKTQSGGRSDEDCHHDAVGGPRCRMSTPTKGGQMRSDTRRNRRRLLESAAELVREDPQALTLAAVAARAEVSVATAYRYFSSLEELLTALMQAIVDGFLDFRESSLATDGELFEELLGRWVELMAGDEGPVMVQLRSRLGFLQRLRDADPVISGVAHVWAPAVLPLLTAAGATREQLPHALMLLNVLVDPREILDMRQVLKMTPAQIRATLSATYRAALQVWVRQIGDTPPARVRHLGEALAPS